ncbi:D-glycero-beta-D-manno-heptose 1,7-bisphosphate 7-phosphatase [Variovorax sp. PCZ-1]|uniref:D-glycero-beta-D-manno-heptose 1,7-bisphosphate 7-phosphatase n=1 Tax=Variovorax sp. PCZ-1 TaxID=2835533 RepID=UPI001BCDA0E0|nr:D-glycero-beta-D-manno-heptose 1,7-bisphosphate 7-phosphatase [Variovorax sp. PCZ-1]MBS7808104.1 D-glycero-beta-D-manno-heptose 1,7-bisphosphate 7-phosphatase [Variovorax sp. PCZ-1]
MKLIILDRDGTINFDRDDYVKSPEQWQPLPGALEAIARLNQAGWHVVVATNQSGLGRGLFDAAALNAMHAKMHKLLAAVGGKIDAVFYCPHTPEDHCDCRKPAPGLFAQILQRHGVDPKDTTVHSVGDTPRDLQAAVAAHCQPHLVLTGKAELLRGTLQNGQLLGAATNVKKEEDEAMTMTRVNVAEFPSGTRVHTDLAAFADHLLSA